MTLKRLRDDSGFSEGRDGGGEGGGGLFDFLPPPDPKKVAAVEATAKARAEPKLCAEDKSKVIFLDIDGVLLPAGETEVLLVDGEFVPRLPNIQEANFNATALDALRMIFHHVGASIVLSSEWRRTEELRHAVGIALRTRGLPQIRGLTTTALKQRPALQKADRTIAFVERRAREIGDWLQHNPGVKAWVALDDLNFIWADGVRAKGSPLLKSRSVRIDAVKCMSEQDAMEAVRILRHPPDYTEEQELSIERRAARKLQEAYPMLKPGYKEPPAARGVETGSLPPQAPPRRM